MGHETKEDRGDSRGCRGHNVIQGNTGFYRVTQGNTGYLRVTLGDTGDTRDRRDKKARGHRGQ